MMTRNAISILLVGTFLLCLAVGCGGGETTPSQTAPSADVAGPAVGEGMVPSGSSSISGTVQFAGAVPTLRPLNLSADPGCTAKHTEPMLPEILVLGEGNTLANVLVKVKSGLPAGQWKAPSEPFVMDQQGCRYVPHLAALMVGQTFRILNSDGLLHNVHALPQLNQEFNMAMPATVTQSDKVFEKAETAFRIKCDVHPWMGAFVEVLSHPFFAVTGKDGKFAISGLKAGTYEIEAWHERLGTQTVTVTVAENATESADFTFTTPKS